MQIIVLTNESLKAELLSNTQSLNQEILWTESISELENHQNADVVIDLLFEKKHIISLQTLLPKLIIINSVETTLAETHLSFVRINGWPTFLRSPIIEASSPDEGNKKKTEEIFSLFNKKLEWLPDEIGLVTPRVISMIINEAFISLEEGVSSKQEIDTAMKLGTNYPYGPFEWAEKIGVTKITSLLKGLKNPQDPSIPSSLLL
jgi:3-hydroxybutyryl-CoA dehydrogenase